MSRKHIVFVISAVVVSNCLPYSALAKKTSVVENIYLSTKNKPSVIQMVNGYNLSERSESSISMGYRNLSDSGAASNLRFEGELSFKKDTIDNSGVNKTAITSSVIYDFNKGSSIRPYLGLGAGLMSLKSENEYNDPEIMPTYEITSGITYKSETAPAMQFDLGYSYTSSAKSASPVDKSQLYNRYEYDLLGHSVAASVKFNF